MTALQLAQIYQLQLERITAIIEGEISGTSVAQFPPSNIGTRLPVVVPMLTSDPNENRAHTVYDFDTTWRLYVYLKESGQGLEMVNSVDVYLYIGQFYQAFLSRRGLKYNNANLPYARDSSIQLVSAMNDSQRYPPRGGQALFWGCQFDLTIFTTNITLSSN